MRFGEAYLVDPALFPETRSGERWGNREVTIHLPGGPYRFSGLDGSQEEIVRERMGDLCSDNEAALPGVEMEVFRVPDSRFLEFDRRGWTYSLDIDCQPASVRIAGADFMGRFDWGPYLRGALWTSMGKKQLFIGVIENYFRILFSYRLLECGGAMIHSACVVDDGGAYLFVGTSGAGKSTIARLSCETGRSVLSDDLNALRLMGSESVVQKLPFGVDFGSTSTDRATYPLRGICRLQKGCKNKIQPMSRAESIASLLTCSPNVNINPHQQDRLVSNLETLTATVPTWVLTFSLAGGFWELLKKDCEV